MNMRQVGSARKECLSSDLDTPLWSADHLPLKGGDRLEPSTSCASSDLLSFLVNVGERGISISPLEGEMVGRPEGGIHAAQRRLSLPSSFRGDTA
ncbi:hypothetical protein SAMN05880593_13013 [Rhizobium sp. RU36D]|nr:hypothetical protein SAMN05880593_13013 [Rhizobium sp. RU36D]